MKYLSIIALALLAACSGGQSLIPQHDASVLTHRLGRHPSIPTIYVATSDKKVSTWTLSGSTWSDTGPDKTFSEVPASIDVDTTTNDVAVALNSANTVNFYTLSGSGWSLDHSDSAQAPVAVRLAGPNAIVAGTYTLGSVTRTGVGLFREDGTNIGVSQCIGYEVPACHLNGAIGLVVNVACSISCPQFSLYAESLDGSTQHMDDCEIYKDELVEACGPFFHPIAPGGNYGVASTLSGGGTSSEHAAIAFGTDLKNYGTGYEDKLGELYGDLTTLNSGTGEIPAIGGIDETSDYTMIMPVNAGGSCKIYAVSAITGTIDSGFPFSVGSKTCNDAAGTGF